MITQEVKQLIIDRLKERESIEGSRQNVCRKYDLRPDILSRMLNGETDKVLSVQRWLRLARRFDIPLNNEVKIETAQTPTFKHIWAQLEFAQEHSVSGMLCDRADIGKTHTATLYARQGKNVVYIDCAQCKSSQAFIRALAKGFGLEHTGSLRMVRDDLFDYVKTVDKPLVILDEFGDLSLGAYMEFKAFWNATDHYCGFYAMGANGLRRKIENNISKNIIGFEEIFSRLGNKFQRITPQDTYSFKKFQDKQMIQIAKANGIDNIQEMLARSNGSLRRISIQKGIEKKNDKTNNN
uniref:AAA family ATPase n=1 Tax=uncultured Draconibacterium sp. TaxID=1573823 RepID=UPI00321624D7